MRSVRYAAAMLSIVALLFAVSAGAARVSLADEPAGTLYGPETFVRDTGKPALEVREISTLGFSAPFILHVQNGDPGGADLSTGSRVLVNGVEVLGPKDFAAGRGGASHSVPVNLGDSSVLSVQVLGEPGSKLTIWIEGQPVPTAQFFTIWSDGEGGVIERLHTVELGNPYPLDVDADPGADLVGTINVSTSGEFTASIARAPGVTKVLPVSTEAIVKLQPGMPFGRQSGAFGYDQRESSAPDFFEATLTLSNPTLDLNFEQQGAAGTTSVIASLFDGAVDDRETAINARTDYDTSPSTGSIAATFNSIQLLLTSNMPGAVAAFLEDNANDLSLRVEIENLPASLDLSIDTDLARLSYEAGGPVDFLHVAAASGSGLFLDTSNLLAEFNQAPDIATLDFPPSGSLVSVQAGQPIGQLRFVLSDGTESLPDRSIASMGDPVLPDAFRFYGVPGAQSVSGRLTALSSLEVSLDPFNIALEQDAASTRSIQLEGVFGPLDNAVTVNALLNKPHATTNISSQLDPGQPVRFVFDNSANMQRFELASSGIEGNDSVVVTLENVSRRMSVCIDGGPACERPNPHGVQRYATPTTTVVSMDFDDFGTHGSGTGSAFRTTMNATIDQPGNGPAIRLTDVRFRNLGFDIEDSNNPHASNCGSLPRLSMFVDSRGHPFAINEIVHPALINELRIGTDTNPARASNRISRLNGWATGFFGCLGGFNQSHAGGLSCGGQAHVGLRTALGNINALNFLTFQWNVCGGTVPNPQPW